MLHPSISTALMRPRRPKQYCLQLVIYIYIKQKKYIYLKVSCELPRSCHKILNTYSASVRCDATFTVKVIV